MMVMGILLLVLSSLLSDQVMGESINSAKAKSLDAILQEYAYKALVKPKTGTIYNATSNFTGVTVAALRLRSGSLRRYGVPNYNEFQIPKGLIETPYVKRLVLVYHNLGNWSINYYPLPPNHTYLAPLLGLLAYNGSDLSATNLSYLNLNASAAAAAAGGDPILVRFQDVKTPPPGSATLPKCVYFDLFGSSHFTNITRGNTCSTFQQGHFSIVLDTTPSAISPLPTPQKESKSSKKKVWIIVGSVLLGGLLLVTFLSLLVLWVLRCKQTKKIQEMERAAEVGEALQMTTVGNTKAPTASFARTLPTIEDEYAP